jgi:hypothetical protein
VLLLVAACAAVGATLAFANAISKSAWTAGSLPPTAAEPPPSSLAPQSNSPYPSDGRGFVNSNARCEGTLTEVAIARTEGSLVAICVDQKGTYQYRGVRLSDGAALNVSAEATDAREYVGRGDGVTYELGTEQLVIIAGDTLVRRENVIEYREPHTFSAQAPPVPSSRRPAS